MCPSHEVVEVISGFCKSGAFDLKFWSFLQKILNCSLIFSSGATVDRTLKGHYE
jgi:hypothetical protein